MLMFHCPMCGAKTEYVVCQNNVSKRDHSRSPGYLPRIDGCGKCIDVYGLWYRYPLEYLLKEGELIPGKDNFKYIVN